MTKILNLALKIKGGDREGGTCEVFRPCHPPKIWNVLLLIKCMGKTHIEFTVELCERF